MKKRVMIGLPAVLSVLALVMAACSGGGKSTQTTSADGSAVFAISDAAADMGSISALR